MGWRILYVEESDFLSLYLDNVKVKNGLNDFTFPISDLMMIIVDNYKLNITAGLMLSCGKNNVPIVLCGDSHHPELIVLPLSGHFESSKIFLTQLNWSEINKKIYWKTIVQRKIENQRKVLYALNNDCTTIATLDKYIDEVTIGDETNREGLAAKVYFKSLFGPEFHRNDENVINASLNYGYSIIRAMISRTIVAKGLNPQIGIFHKGATNYFNLSDDIFEIFRPLVDAFVWNNFKDTKIFNKDCRLKLLEMLTMKLEIEDTKQTVYHCVERVIDDMIKFFNQGLIPSLVKFDPFLYDL